mmetsp:Transcript_5359/g.14904  ORF Transcript_5359/g.14904 Transcript_5359/m.14904 type:complete len:587 (-) Transcript_5359:100-1860(-)|eukprot:CAMPEP_0117657308 /NCGR_PEP_ID=MMETSP0804-20121206/5261_1 /TAXON_ID=1074897 /ORGANISM="Tetraselmis astigmatica, Strain CCMP880" /LENGTH=586 /DNA_ID=CAMNT_0005463753 /DNA_START=163 /DNA_END=1923 /DNA_ORIENTATION=+
MAQRHAFAGVLLLLVSATAVHCARQLHSNGELAKNGATMDHDLPDLQYGLAKTIEGGLGECADRLKQFDRCHDRAAGPANCCRDLIDFWNAGCFCDPVVMGFSGRDARLGDDSLTRCLDREAPFIEEYPFVERKCDPTVYRDEGECETPAFGIDQLRVESIIAAGDTWYLSKSFKEALSDFTSVTSDSLVAFMAEDGTVRQFTVKDFLQDKAPPITVLPEARMSPAWFDESFYGTDEISFHIVVDGGRPLYFRLAFERCTTHVREMIIDGLDIGGMGAAVGQAAAILPEREESLADEDYDPWMIEESVPTERSLDGGFYDLFDRADDMADLDNDQLAADQPYAEVSVEGRKPENAEHPETAEKHEKWFHHGWEETAESGEDMKIGFQKNSDLDYMVEDDMDYGFAVFRWEEPASKRPEEDESEYENWYDDWGSDDFVEEVEGDNIHKEAVDSDKAAHWPVDNYGDEEEGEEDDGYMQPGLEVNGRKRSTVRHELLSMDDTQWDGSVMEWEAAHPSLNARHSAAAAAVHAPKARLIAARPLYYVRRGRRREATARDAEDFPQWPGPSLEDIYEAAAAWRSYSLPAAT